MRSWLTGMLAIGIATVAGGCGGDRPTTTEPVDTDFRVVVAAVDASGAPVANLNVGVVNDIFIDADKTASPDSVTIPLVLPEQSLLRIFIEDLNGDRRRTLVDEVYPVGLHFVPWDGKDDEGAPLPAGRYTIFTWIFPPNGSETVFRAQKDVFLKREPTEISLGRTGAEGLFTITDLNLFPGLLPLGPMVATDATGETIGTVLEMPTMTFAVWDDEGHVSSDAFAIQPGPNAIDLVFDATAKAAAAGVGPANRMSAYCGAQRLDDANFEMRNPFPNPFN